MIFLVSTANSRYGFYNGNDTRWYSGEIYEGDTCFIVNVTVRNDYKNPIIADSPLNGTYYQYISLTIPTFIISKVELMQLMLHIQLIGTGVVTSFL